MYSYPDVIFVLVSIPRTYILNIYPLKKLGDKYM